MTQTIPTQGRSATPAEIAQAISQADRFLLTTHEGPDGDALGSLLGLHQILRRLGKDSVMFLAVKEFPLPIEYRFLPLAEVFHEPPADLSDRMLVYLDCGNIERASAGMGLGAPNPSLNIDHHHDNTNFAELNLVDPVASCTAELIFDLAKLLGVELDAEIASALYVGVVTDTGKFMYSNTAARTHRMVAALIDAGVDVDDTYRRLYEHVPPEKIRLVARALNAIDLRCEGRLALAYITETDYRETGADESMTEGIIDHIRSIDGTMVAAMVRDLGDRGRAKRKVSLRATDDRIDVSAIARSHGGGGHVRASGFSTDSPYDEIAETIRVELEAQLAAI